MHKYAFFLMAALGLNVANANQLQPNYFKGLQPIGIAGDTIECLVETTFSAHQERVKVRTLVADSHDQTKVVGFGPVIARYNVDRNGYLFVEKKTAKELRILFLDAPIRRTARGLSLEISHGSHTDPVACNDLNLLQGTELDSAVEKFKRFDDFVEDGDHDHDHGHQHKRP
jgi:hypothetical protein